MTTTISELEKKRLENIERNAQYLSELGLASSSTTRTTSSNKSSSRRRPNTSTAAVVKAVVEIDPSLLRRSSRVAALAPVDYSEPAALPSSSSTKKRSFVGTEIVEQEESNVSHLPQDIPVGTFKGLSQQDDEVQQGEIKEDAHAASSSGSTSNTSCSTLNAQLSFILSTYLGKVFPDYGKASVMSESNGGKLPKFNKYPGVLEWKNCIYLWVNIGGSGGYTNNFFEKGKQMIWYGGSTMHSESKVVKRLIIAGKGKAVDSDTKIKVEPKEEGQSTKEVEQTEQDQVILFARIDKEAYACLGRVKYVAIDLECSPIVMKWELLDYDRLITEEYFQDILKSAKCMF